MARLVLSQNERLILHLWQVDRYRDEPEVPIGASQEGISQKLQIQVHNASRALASLESEGLVFDRLAHVRGAPKRRRAYFLTDRGVKAANSIKLDVGNRLVILEHLGQTTEMTLDDVLLRIAQTGSRSPDFLQLAEHAKDNDVIRLEEFVKPAAAGPIRVSHFEKVYGRPKVASFYGRASELKEVSDLLAREDTSVILIWGIPGIGKSTLASKFFESMSGKHSMLWYACREWDSDTTIVPVISDFLSSAGLSAFSTGARKGTSIEGLFDPLCEDMSSAPLLFFFDDVQKLGGRTSSLLSMVIESARASGKSKVILVARAVPIFFSSTASGSSSLELKELDRDSAWQMARGLNAPTPIDIVERSRGNPLLLNLMARAAPGRAVGDINSFIEREVCSSLSEQEMSFLKQLSVFRHPVSAAAVSGSEIGVISKLKDSALVYEQEQGIWAHDLLRDFFLSRSNPDEKVQMHKVAAAYCSSRSGAEWRLEHLYHLVEGRDWAQATKIAVEAAQELAKEFPQETSDLLERISLEGAEPSQVTEMLFIRGQLRAGLGLTELALADFESILAGMTDESEAPRKALVLEAVARLQSEVERWSEALSSHQKALQIHERSKDSTGQARELMGIGAIHRKKKDFGSAREAYDKAMALFSAEEDRAGQAACLNNIALLEWDEGRLGASEKRFKESVGLAHTVKDQLGEARGLENLAELTRAQFRYTESMDMLREAAEAFRRAGEISDFKRLKAELAKALANQGKSSEGIALCASSLESPELRRKPGLFQKAQRYDDGDIALSSILVELHRSSGDIGKARRELSRMIEMATALRNAAQMARSRMMEATLQEDAGELESAAKSLRAAESILKEAGDLLGLVAVQIRMGVIEEKLGNDSAAVSRYRDAVRNAEIAGDRKALAYSMENLGQSLDVSSAEGRTYLDRAMDLFQALGMATDANRIRIALQDLRR